MRKTFSPQMNFFPVDIKIELDFDKQNRTAFMEQQFLPAHQVTVNETPVIEEIDPEVDDQMNKTNAVLFIQNEDFEKISDPIEKKKTKEKLFFSFDYQLTNNDIKLFYDHPKKKDIVFIAKNEDIYDLLKHKSTIKIIRDGSVLQMETRPSKKCAGIVKHTKPEKEWTIHYEIPYVESEKNFVKVYDPKKSGFCTKFVTFESK